jgi:hypothetical protein
VVNFVMSNGKKLPQFSNPSWTILDTEYN